MSQGVVMETNQTNPSETYNYNGNGIKPKPRTPGLIHRTQTNIQDNTQPTVVVDNHINYFGVVLPKKDQRLSLYERIQHNTYEFLYKPSGLFSYTYHILVLILVLLCLIMTFLITVQQIAVISWKIMDILEKVIIAWFAFEFVIRLWASGCRPEYQGWNGKVRYLCRIESIIDLVVIVVSAVVLGLQPINLVVDTSIVFAAAALRGFHRLFIVIRLVWARKSTSGVDSAVSPFRMFVSVLYSQREQLAIITYISFVVFFIGSFLVYLAETQTNSQFKNIANSFWWAVETVITVGYGDIVPITIPGKFLASIFMIIGFWLFALPTEVIGTGVALRVEKMEADVIHSPQLIPAVILIQSYWRFYASNHKPLSQTTWYIPHNRVIVDRNQQNVVRFIRAVKLLTAKQAFKTMCRKTNKHMAHKNTHTEHRQFVNRIKLLQFEVKGVEERLVLTEDRMVEDLVTRIDRINELNRKISEKFMKQSQLLERLLNSEKN